MMIVHSLVDKPVHKGWDPPLQIPGQKGGCVFSTGWENTLIIWQSHIIVLWSNTTAVIHDYLSHFEKTNIYWHQTLKSHRLLNPAQFTFVYLYNLKLLWLSISLEKWSLHKLHPVYKEDSQHMKGWFRRTTHSRLALATFWGPISKKGKGHINLDLDPWNVDKIYHSGPKRWI